MTRTAPATKETTGMLFDGESHDVFISYAREDSDWVRRNLYAPLLKSRTSEGRPPRVFFDVGEHGIRIGQDFQRAIDRAIEKARRFIPVYSSTYFQKEMCLYELDLARSRDVTFQEQLLLPILIDEAAVEKIPFAFKRLNFLSVKASPNWFGQLCQALELQPSTEELTLTFLDQPGDVRANHTLPVVRVAVQSEGAPIRYDDEITVQAENGRLLGTTTMTTREGVAAFDDLSVADVVGTTRLIARSLSAGETATDRFTVLSHAGRTGQLPREKPGQVTIPTSGEVVFFATGQHLAVIQPQRILAYTVDGQPILTEPLSVRAPIRLIRRRAGQLVLADWQGNVYLLCDDGRHREWRFGESASGFVVPGDVDIDNGQIYVSFWSGSIFRLQESGEVELVLNDNAGVQAMGVYEDQLYTCDFSGNLRVYRNKRLVNTATVEPTIWLLMGTPSCLVGVGEHKFYHISAGGTRVIDFDMPLSEIVSVYELSDLPIVIDTEGKGIRFDANLVINTLVHTQPGAEPVSADHAGIYCIFRNPDATRTLLVRDRIVFSHAQGCLAVNPQGQVFALGDQSSIQLYSESAFQELIRRKETEVGQAEHGDDRGTSS